MPSRLVAPISLLALLACATTEAPAPTPDPEVARAAVDSVLTALHQTASEGAWDLYFALYAPDAVFFGTDATERWSLEEFRGYASASRGWTYQMTERHVFVDDDASTAWFDERLENAAYGETRGTGVLRRTDDGWKIVQYNLTIPIPNPLAAEFAERIRGLDAAPADTSATPE